jgi:rhodanese-related sulfurtransferase
VTFARPREVPEIDTERLAAVLAEGAPLIDVRMPDEYAQVRVPGAVCIPLPELGSRTDEVPADRQVYVICATGARSAAAVEALNKAGWDTVNVAGGTKAWAAEGRPVDAGPPA